MACPLLAPQENGFSPPFLPPPLTMPLGRMRSEIGQGSPPPALHPPLKEHFSEKHVTENWKQGKPEIGQFQP